MPVEKMDEIIYQSAIQAGRAMAASAVTAPVMGGAPVTEVALVYGKDEIERMVSKLEDIAFSKEKQRDYFLREANMLRECVAVLLIGTRRAYDPFGVACGMCLGDMGEPGETGRCDKFHKTKKLKDVDIPGPVCSERIQNLGYSVGSALWIASRLFIDTKPKYSIGLAALKLGYMPGCKFIVGLPLSITPKNPFVDVIMDPSMSRQNMIDRLERVWNIIRSLHAY